MNVNIIAVTLSYLKLIDISNIFEKIACDKNVKDTVILSLSRSYSTNYFNINGKINNYKYRCGQCNEFLIGEYSTKLGFKNCSICGEKEKFNIDLCDNCSGFKSKRGTMNVKYCNNNHTILYLGVNILSY